MHKCFSPESSSVLILYFLFLALPSPCTWSAAHGEHKGLAGSDCHDSKSSPQWALHCIMFLAKLIYHCVEMQKSLLLLKRWKYKCCWVVFIKLWHLGFHSRDKKSRQATFSPPHQLLHKVAVTVKFSVLESSKNFWKPLWNSTVWRQTLCLELTEAFRHSSTNQQRTMYN